ncbi:unnamed protein product, partial [Mesorhabditis belari]|uniref:Uncharacterized protein n=1 Tax=Mesorhabditis belari TaxID=2138241 RepID=A0AAF3F7B0_9BILA
MDRERGRLRLSFLFCLISFTCAYPQFQNEIYRKRLPSFLTAKKTQTRRSSDYGPPAHVPVYINPYPEVPELPNPKQGTPAPPGADSYQKIVLGDQSPSKHHDEPQKENTEGPIPPPTPSAPKSRLDEIARQVQKLLLDSKGHVDTNKIPEPVKKPGSKAPGFSPNRRSNAPHKVNTRDLAPIQKSGYDAEAPKTKTNGGITIHSSGYNFDGDGLPNSVEEDTSTVASTYEDRDDSRQGYDDKNHKPNRGNIDEGENSPTNKPKTQKPRYEHTTRPTTTIDYYPYRQKGYRVTTRATPKPTTTQAPKTTTRSQGYEQDTVTPRNGYDYSNRNTARPRNNGDDYSNRNTVPSRNNGYEENTVAPRNGYEENTPAPRNGYEENTVAPRHGYEENTPAPRNGYEDNTVAPRHGYEESTPAPRNGYEENTPAPRHGYEENTVATDGYGKPPVDNGYEKPKDNYDQTVRTPEKPSQEYGEETPNTYEQAETTTATPQDNGYEQGNEKEQTNNENPYEESHKVNPYDMLVEHSGDDQAEGYHTLLAKDAKAYVEEHKRLQRAMAKRIYAEIRKQIKRELDLDSDASSAKEKSAEKLSESSEQLKEAQHEEPYSAGKPSNENSGYEEPAPQQPDGYDQPKDEEEVHEAHPSPPKEYLENIEESEHPSTPRPTLATALPDVKKLVNNFAKQSENQAKATRHQTGHKTHTQSTTPKDFGFDGSVDRVTTPIPQDYIEVHVASPLPPVDLYGESPETTQAPKPEPSTQGYDEPVHEAKPVPPVEYEQPQETTTSTPENPYEQYPPSPAPKEEKIDEGEKNRGYDEKEETKENEHPEYPSDGWNGFPGGDDNQHKDSEEKPEEKTDSGYPEEKKSEEKGGNTGYPEEKGDHGYDGAEKNGYDGAEKNGYDGAEKNGDDGEEKKGYDGAEKNGDDGAEKNGYEDKQGNGDNKGNDDGEIDEGEDKKHKKNRDDKHKTGPPGIEPHGDEDGDQKSQEQHISYTETEDGDDGDQGNGGNGGNGGNYGGYSAQPADSGSSSKWTRGHRRELVVTQKIRSTGKQKQRVFIDYEKGGRPQIYAKQDQDASKSTSSSESAEDERRMRARGASRFVPFNQVRHLFL